MALVPVRRPSGLRSQAWHRVAYLEHPVLGERLKDCTALVNAIQHRSVAQIFGYPDDLKFHSSMTLFAKIAEELPVDIDVFQGALARHFANALDAGTLRQLDRDK
jgi:uncharacterized protein (DUF1810 family)